MSLKKSSIIMVFVVMIVSSNYAQMSTSYHEKYWFYRERLKYFTQPGEGIGKSIIADTRNGNKTQDLTLGDQTIDLGWYLAILALEYKELGTNSLENDQTLTEIYYAIKAFERLDLCETYEPWNKDEPPLAPICNRCV